MAALKADDALPRLLVLASTYPRWAGDIEPGFVHELCQRLATTFQVLVLTPSAPGAAENELIDGVQVRRYRYAPRRWETLIYGGGILANLRCFRWKWALVPGFLLGLAWALWRVERRWAPNLIHAHWLLPQGLIAALRSEGRRKAAPFVITSHGADLYALRSKPFKFLKRLVVERAASVTVVSHAMVDEVTALCTAAPTIHVQSMGVDFARRFHPNPAIERDFAELLFVGRFVEKKGLRRLIDAMPTILQRLPAARLTVVGFGPEEAARRSQVEMLHLSGRIRFVGAVPQRHLPAYYQRAGVLVVPFVTAASGDQEGLGLVMLEAAGCGCRVVAGALPAVCDVADGELIRSVSIGSQSELSAAVVAALKKPDLVRAQQARQNLVANFDWSVVASRYADLLLQVVSAEARRA